MPDVSALLSPERLVVVGATDRPASVGRALVENLAGFAGEVHHVNPNRETVLGEPCFPTVAAVPAVEAVDLAVVVVPAPAVVEVVREVAAAGIGAAVVISAGFGEAGAEGRRRERDLVAVARAHDLALLGPNCVGVINTAVGLNATFLVESPPAGRVALVSQSGAFVSAVLGRAAHHGLGFSTVVSLGNEAVLDEVALLRALEADPATDVVLAYLEDVDDGRAFIETARAVTATTPVVALKAGRTAAGARAAASHTGALAGSDAAYRAAFRQAGVHRATTIEELFDAGQALATLSPPEHEDVAIVTNGGGPGVLAADAVDESPLSLATFDESLRAELGSILPASATAANPLDLVGDAGLDRFRAALDAVLGSTTVGAAVVICVPTATMDYAELAATVATLRDRHGKPVVACLMGGASVAAAAESLSADGVPNYFDPARAVRSLATLAEQRAVTERRYGVPTAFDVDRSRAEAVLHSALERGVDHLGVEAMGLLEAYGIPTPPGEVATDPAGAEAAATSIGGPVVLKVVSPDVLHKSDVGGVEVGVPVDRVAETYRSIVDRIRRHDPDATLLGIQVQAYVDPADATETIVGASRDPQFGHLLAFGLGGVFVQVFEDTAFRVAPVSATEARAMTEEIHAASMLRGARGRPPADLDAVVEAIGRLSQLVSDFPAIEELDVNPLLAGPDGVCALDLRLTVDRTRLRGDGG